MTSNQNTVLGGETFKLFKAMVGIGLICAALIAAVYDGTQPRIKHLKALALEEAVFQVVPRMVSKKTYQYVGSTGFTEVTEATTTGDIIYAGYDENGDLVGFAIQASGMGFADVIKVIYGYDPVTGKIVGYKVLENKETPGLGDKIEKDQDFLNNFLALDVSLDESKSALINKLKAVKAGQKQNPWEIDGITGATISSRAIGAIFQQSTENWIPKIAKNIDIFKSQNATKNAK